MTMPSLKIVTGIALLSLLLWKIFSTSKEAAVTTLCRLLIVVFAVTLIWPYAAMVSIIKSVLINEFELNYRLAQIFREFKGTDYADGVLSAFFTFLYGYFIIHLWKKSKPPKPPTKKEPFEIHATIKNSQKEEKQAG